MVHHVRGFSRPRGPKVAPVRQARLPVQWYGTWWYVRMTSPLMASTATDSRSPRGGSEGGQTQVESTDRTVQFKLNAQSLCLFGLHRDVNDAHRAGANRLQNNKQPFCMVAERGCPTLGDSCCFSSPGAAAGRVAASATNDAAEHARVDEPLRVGEE